MRNQLAKLLLAGMLFSALLTQMTAFAAPVASDLQIAAEAESDESDPTAGTGREIIVSRDDKDKD